MADGAGIAEQWWGAWGLRKILVVHGQTVSGGVFSPVLQAARSSFLLTKLFGTAKKVVLRDVAQPGSAPASGAGGR